ncbi:pirin family protein [Tessaracoccus rhinocerotis]|uniref:Pirin family protein n=1 Tax=Tessaracoccus rhinocerotis TaxID=1689449 RepID=A0A553JY70_9ACTN|nr:pirin family protein [Tessaracoccus rhinocerotis]TRY17390.1 pirin family protein [Tessaracoccus rhinocerotis]
MSNTDTHPDLVDCVVNGEHHPDHVQVIQPKEVSLGGADAMQVRRTLPSMTRSFVGAWCFADHYGPEEGICMDVPPHPHTSLQTVSWLFSGEIEHRDSAGVHEMVRPGEVNLMTSGHGISHSEVSTPRRELLHGVQLWVVLPEEDKDLVRDFQHHVPDLHEDAGVRAKVLVGSLDDASSPVRSETPLLGAEVVLDPGVTWEFAVDPGFEHGVLVDTGHVDFDGVRLDRSTMGVRDAGLDHVRLTNPTDSSARMMLLGGEPFDEGIVMWWNFIGRSHEDIVRLRKEWNEAPDDRFGRVRGYRGQTDRLPAPELPPSLRLKRRFRRGRER